MILKRCQEQTCSTWVKKCEGFLTHCWDLVESFIFNQIKTQEERKGVSQGYMFKLLRYWKCELWASLCQTWAVHNQWSSSSIMLGVGHWMEKGNYWDRDASLLGDWSWWSASWPLLWGAYLSYIFRVILYQSFPFRFYSVKEQCHKINIILAAAGSQ